MNPMIVLYVEISRCKYSSNKDNNHNSSKGAIYNAIKAVAMKSI
jgi:hypothetical protein